MFLKQVNEYKFDSKFPFYFLNLKVLAPKVEEIKISTLTTENPVETNKYSIQIISNSLNDFQFSFNDVDLRIEIKNGDLFNEIADVMVYSANNILQLSCMISNFKKIN